MKKIVISSDSPMDLPVEFLEKYDIKVSPMHVTLGDQCFDDGVNITPEDIYKFYDESKKLPKTSATSVSEYISFFEKYVDDGYDLIHISMSAELSSTHQNAVIAAEEVEGVFVIDSKSITGGMAMLAIKAAELREKGLSAIEIYEECFKLREKISVSFILDKLEFLQKGGRCSATTAFGANILGIKPSITMQDGKLGVGKKYRGRLDNCRAQYFNELFDEATNADKAFAILVYTAGVSENDINVAKESALKHGFSKIYLKSVGCVITAHCGKNTIGFVYINR